MEQSWDPMKNQMMGKSPSLSFRGPNKEGNIGGGGDLQKELRLMEQQCPFPVGGKLPDSLPRDPLVLLTNSGEDRQRSSVMHPRTF